MGGKVLVESEEGKGSTFSVTFKVMCKISANNSDSAKIDRDSESGNNLSNSQDNMLPG